MHYTKVELKGYRRLQLSNIQIIRMEPEQVIQLILGTNGSGKSSLLREITPLPSSHTQYEKDGYKLLEMTHNGFSYRAINTFDGKTGKYSLTKDGSEIFQGSTVTDYRTLIKQEFGITPDIQMLVDGLVKFSTMDLAKRRLWFTLLSQADYTYAFKYYNGIRTRIRDLQGALTISQNRYVGETSKILSPEEVEQVRSQLELYRSSLHQLLEQKPRIPYLKGDIEKTLNNIDLQLEPLKKRVTQLQNAFARELRPSYQTQPVSLEFFQQELFRIQSEIETLKDLEENTHETLNSLMEGSYDQECLQSVSIEEREAICSRLSFELVQTEATRHTRHVVRDAAEFKSSFETICDVLRNILEEIPEGSAEYSRSLLDIHSSRKDGIAVRLKNIDLAISKEQENIRQMEHAKQHHMRTCPKCDHHWYHGYEEIHYHSLINSLDKHIKERDSLTDDFKKCNETLIEIQRVLDLRNKFHYLVRNWTSLTDLWEAIEKAGGYNNPKSALSVIQCFVLDIPVIQKIDQISKDLTNASKLLIEAKERSYLDLDVQKEKIESTEKYLVQTQDKLRRLTDRQRSVSKLIELFKSTQSVIDSYGKLETDRSQQLSYLHDSLKVEHFNRLIAMFRQELVSLEQTISKIDIQQNVILQLQNQISDYQEQIRLMKLAEQALSPSTGLIAKGLTGFINWFISKMNGFVSNIWTYPLEILPIAVTDDLELDYKFPVSVDNGRPAADIKAGECNTATCEVFDLAFRIMAMECLGLGNYPLQLDEFGGSFDHRHRNTAFQVVTSLIVSSNIPQVFLVSHAEQSYGSLKNSDVTVLHADNVSLPSGVVPNGRTFIG